MPLVEVKLYDARVTEESVPRIIEAMTEALAESSGASREHIWVIVEGVSPVPTVLDNYARAKLIVKTTLLHARETAEVVRDGEPVELRLVGVPAPA